MAFQLLANAIGQLAQHVREVLDRQELVENELALIERYLRNTQQGAQVGPVNPIGTQAYVDLVQISDVDGDVWSGIPLRTDNDGLLGASAFDLGVIYGQQGAAPSMPSVGQIVGCVFVGQEATPSAVAPHHALLSAWDTYKVKVDSQHTQPGYAYEIMYNKTTYVSTIHQAVYCDVVGTGAGTQLRFFTVASSSASAVYRAIRAQTTANVSAEASTFSVDHIELLAGSLDPRTVPDSTSETLTIHKEDVPVALRDNDWITAIYNNTDGQWELLPTERKRSIRGTWYSGTSTLLIDHIVVLENGLDPRGDPTSDTEVVSVNNVASDTYGSGDKVYADWNAKDGVWEARPKGGSSGSNLRKARVYSTISAATSQDSGDWGSGQVKLQDANTGELDADPTDVDNLWIGIAWVNDAQVSVDTSYTPPRVENGTCGPVSWGS